MKRKKYGTPPIKIDEIKCISDEMFFYQYLPIKMVINPIDIKFGYQLEFAQDLINRCCGDFIKEYGYKEFENHYIYLTAKRMYVNEGQNLNRPGWHSDGFGTNDINYIWCDSVPTEFILCDYTAVPKDDHKALESFQEVGEAHERARLVKKIEVNTIYRLDETVIHSTAKHIGLPIIRTFIKISFSKEKYNLKGNSHNYLFDYEWEMKDRELTRNHPIK